MSSLDRMLRRLALIEDVHMWLRTLAAVAVPIVLIVKL